MEERRFRQLIVWQRAMALNIEVHRLAKGLKGRDRAELADQIRRAALSIPANIAEGNGRSHRADYLRFLSIANGSLSELDSHLEVARCLEYLAPDSLTVALDLLDHTGRLLTRLILALRKPPTPHP